MGRLRPIAAAHRHHEANDLAAAFEAGIRQGHRHDKGKQGIRRHDHVGPRHEFRHQEPSPPQKELAQFIELLLRQRGKPRQRRPLVAVEGRRDTPYAAFARTKLLLLLGRVFMQSVRRVGDDGVEAVVAAPLKPVKTIRMVQFRQAKAESLGCIGHRLRVRRQLQKTFAAGARSNRDLPCENGWAY